MNVLFSEPIIDMCQYVYRLITWEDKRRTGLLLVLLVVNVLQPLFAPVAIAAGFIRWTIGFAVFNKPSFAQMYPHIAVLIYVDSRAVQKEKDELQGRAKVIY